MEKREIERNPKIPFFTEKIVKLLTELCFCPDDRIEPVDLIFVFGSSSSLKKIKDLIKELLDQNISLEVFISGDGSLYNNALKTSGKSESFSILQKINPRIYPKVKFYLEDKSNNTLENVTEALKVLDIRRYKSILYIAKSHASKRCYLTLRKFTQNTKLLRKTFNRLYPNTNTELSRDAWHTFGFGKSRVWGEFLRIKTYGERGDIFYDQKTANLIKKIENELNMQLT